MKNRSDILELKTDDGLYGEVLVHKLIYRVSTLDVRFKTHENFVSFLRL